MKPMADLFKVPQKMGLEMGIWAAKIVVLVAGLASAFLMARTSVPYSLNVLSSVLPGFWISLRSWLVPPYLFIYIHLIIMVIWKLSEEKEHKDERQEETKPRDLVQKPSPEFANEVTSPAVESIADPSKPGATVADPAPTSSEESCVTMAAAAEEEVDDAVSRENDSIEDTWRAIMEGGASPVRRYLTKSSTFVEQGQGLERAVAAVGGVKKQMKKSQTFKEQPSSTAAAAATSPAVEVGWRGREVLAMEHDELNSKFEEFIKKNYEQIRLQHQQYLNYFFTVFSSVVAGCMESARSPNSCWLFFFKCWRWVQIGVWIPLFSSQSYLFFSFQLCSGECFAFSPLICSRSHKELYGFVTIMFIVCFVMYINCCSQLGCCICYSLLSKEILCGL